MEAQAAHTVHTLTHFLSHKGITPLKWNASTPQGYQQHLVTSMHYIFN